MFFVPWEWDYLFECGIVEGCAFYLVDLDFVHDDLSCWALPALFLDPSDLLGYENPISAILHGVDFAHDGSFVFLVVVIPFFSFNI